MTYEPWRTAHMIYSYKQKYNSVAYPSEDETEIATPKQTFNFLGLPSDPPNVDTRYIP